MHDADRNKPTRRDILHALQDDELSEAVKECEKSIRADNPGMDKSTAIAICRDMENRGVLEAYNDAAPADHERDTNTSELAALAEFRNPGDIRRIETDGVVRYENVMLLAPGAWTDAGSRETAIYAAEGIRRTAQNENFVDDRGNAVDALEVNLLHGPALHGASSLGAVGEIPTDSIAVDDADRLFGDIEIHGDTPASELAIELMDETLEAADDPDQEAPPVGPSVEIVDERSEVDPDTGAPRLTELWLSGVGIVFGPASRPVELGEQAQERAIAMSEYVDDEGTAPGLVLRADQNNADISADETGGRSLPGIRHDGSMSPGTRRELAQLLEEMQRLLQTDDELETVQTLIEQYRQAGEDLQNPVTDFMEWVDANADVDVDELQDIMDAYLQAVDADTLDMTPVEGLQGWVEEQMGDAGEADEGENGEGDENENLETHDNKDEDEDMMTRDELQEAVSTIQAFSSELESVKDMLSDYDEQVDALEDQLEETQRRLEDLESEPANKALSEQPQTDFLGEGDSDPGPEEPADHEDVFLD